MLSSHGYALCDVNPTCLSCVCDDRVIYQYCRWPEFPFSCSFRRLTYQSQRKLGLHLIRVSETFHVYAFHGGCFGCKDF